MDVVHPPNPLHLVLSFELLCHTLLFCQLFDQLRRDGFICTVAGKGSFVAQQDLELAKESNLREIEAHLQAAVELGRQIELTVDDLQNILKVLSEEE